MFLTAIDRKTQKRFSIQLEDGQYFYLGRKPDLEVAAKHSGKKEMTALALGAVDGTISRTHAWGVRQGNLLVVHRIMPATGAVTPHPLFSIFGERQQLPDVITLELGQAFGIHPDGFVEFHWVANDDQISQPSIMIDGSKSVELKAVDYKSLGVSDQQMQEELQLIQAELPRVLAAWADPKDLFNGLAHFLQRALPAQREVVATFLAVDLRTMEHEVLGCGHEEHPDFRVSNRLIRDLCSGASAVRGTPRVEKAQAGGNNPNVSIIYKFDWILGVPVGALREEAGMERFQPYFYQGKSVVLYVETRQSIDMNPEKLVPFFRLVTSLASSTLMAFDERAKRVEQTQQSQDLLAPYRDFFIRGLGMALGRPLMLPPESDPNRLACERVADSLIRQDFAAAQATLASLPAGEARSLREVVDHFLTSPPPSPGWRDELRPQNS